MAPARRRPRTAFRSALAFAMLCGTGAACNPIYYSPTTQNVPLLQGRGQFAGTAAASDDRFEVQTAYAVSDRLGIQVNAGAFAPEDRDNGNGGSGEFLEAGAGIMAARNGKLSYDSWLLLAYGNFENHLPSTVSEHPTTTGDIEGSLIRIAVQPVVGYQSRFFEAAVSSRIGGLSYTGVSGDLIFDNEDQVEALRNAGWYFLVEPALTVRAGLESVKLQVQFGTSHNLTDSDFRQDDSMLSLGLFVKLPH